MANGLLDGSFSSAESAALLAPRMVLNMYEQRFGLHRKPFQTVTKAQDFFVSSSFNELLPSVVHALQTDLGVAVLTGPAGVGKSVSLEQIQRNLESTAQTLLLRGGSVKGAADLLYLLHRRLLKLQPEAATTTDSSATSIVRRYEVVERLERVASFWGPLTILLDDAQLVNQEVFSELRSLLEEGHDGRRFARLLIAGPLLLEEVLADAANAHFARKIRTHSFLQPLRSDESIQYLEHHFRLAGGQLAEAFAADSLELIAAAADGMPQCLNLLADECLMVCEETDLNEVSQEIVRQALTRLQHLPYSWNVSMVEQCSGDGYDDDGCSDDFATEAGTLVGENSIEIGEFPADTFSNSDHQPVTSNVAQGVFEIGAPSPTDQVATPAPTTLEDIGAVEIGAVEIGTMDPSVVVEPVTEVAQQVEVEADLSTESAEVMESETVEVLDTDVRYVEIETTLPVSALDSGFAEAVEISEDEFAAQENSLLGDRDASLTPEFLIGDQPTEMTGLAEFVDAEDESCSTRVVESEMTDSIADYEPWDPAGQWPTSPLVADDLQAERLLAENSTATESEAVDGLDSVLADADKTGADKTGGQPDGDVLTEPVWDTETTPVVDQFTWAELGRTASDDNADVVQESDDRSDSDSFVQFAAEWPPVISGVAPASQIPVSQLDDEYAELLNDLGLLIDATAERDAVVDVDSHQPVFEDHATSLDSAELLSSANGPEGTIEELQQLLQHEQELDQSAGRSEDIPEMHSQDDLTVQESTEPDIQDEQSSLDSHSPMASPRFFSMNQTEIDAVDGSLTDGSNPHGPQLQGPDAGVNQFVDLLGGGTGSADEHDPDVVAFQQIVEEHDEWMQQEELLSEMISDALADEERAMPAVLRQARRPQHRSVLTMGLRQAAGAETVSEVAADLAPSSSENTGQLAEDSGQDYPISLPMPEATRSDANLDEALQSPFSGNTNDGSEKKGFANLFTRLRRRRDTGS